MKQRDLVNKLISPGFPLSGTEEIMTYIEEN